MFFVQAKYAHDVTFVFQINEAGQAKQKTLPLSKKNGRVFCKSIYLL